MKLDLLTNKDVHEEQKLVISNIRDLINYKNLEPGDKLPAERVLSEKFGVSRSVIRGAIQQLERYRLLESIPQSGTFVATIGQVALNGIINDLLRLKEHDFESLVQTRILLELKMVELAALRRTEEDLAEIKVAFEQYKAKLLAQKNALQEDLLFHLAIARASGNSTMNELMLQITPTIITVFKSNWVCENDNHLYELEKHQAIYDAIVAKDAVKAVKAMEVHFEMLIEFGSNFSSRNNPTTKE